MDRVNLTTNVIRFFKNIDYSRIANNTATIFERIKVQAMRGTRETATRMLELYYVMLSENTSKFNKLIISAALAYQFLPNDFLPSEDYGVLGYLDNVTVLYFAYKRVKKSITPEISQKVEDTINGWIASAENFTILKPEAERV